MLPANNKAVGLSAGFPDVCLSPVLGLFPFPNFSPNGMKFPFSFNVWISMAAALHQGSFSPMTAGDQAGTLHPTFMGQARYTLGYFKILINYLPGTMLLCVRIGNNFNCILGIQVLPSAVNVFFAYNAASAGGALPAGAPLPADVDEVVYRSSHRNPCRAPLWILVNRGTASAAELFAGCLQWHGRAIVAGERTYGKGTALKVAVDPAERAPVLAPAAMMVLPGGEAIHAVGVRPDVELGSEATAPDGVPPSLAQLFARVTSNP